MKIKKLIIGIFFILSCFQAHAYQVDFKTNLFNNKKNWLTRSDNCSMYTKAHVGTGDIYLLAQQNSELLEPEFCAQGNCRKFSIGYHNKFITSLDRYKLEEIVFSQPECQDGQCEFKIEAVELVRNSSEKERMKKANEQLIINVILKDEAIQINKVFIQIKGKEYVNCYK